MGYATYVGRVGALAVALGVGMAVASTPGIALAEPSGTSSTGGSSSEAKSSSTGRTSAGGHTSSTTGSSAKARATAAGNRVSSTHGSGATGSPASDSDAPSGPADDSTVDSDTPVDEDTAGDVEGAAGDAGAADAGEQTSGEADGDTPRERAPSTGAAPAQDPARDDSPDQPASSGSVGAHAATVADASDGIDRSVAVVSGQSARTGRQQVQTLSSAAAADAGVSYSLVVPASADLPAMTTAAATAVAGEAAPAAAAPAVPQQPPNLVRLVSDAVTAVLQPLLRPGTGSPIQVPLFTAMLAAVRDEIERIFLRRTANVATQPAATGLADAYPQVSLLADPTTQHVLLIGVDGTNMSRILADSYNQNFFDLMDVGTTAASSIVGHTTLSNPSWTAILTGVWGERTGVINNIFTPWTYDTWPTVFNQLEGLDSDIKTQAVADWSVTAAIAEAGSLPADDVAYIPQIEGDTNWSETDDAVGDATVEALSLANPDAPNFLFSYFVGVDENGHMYGGASPQYAEAIRNVNDNLGDILSAVDERETTLGEDWTVIVVTDHGHQPQKGFGHGFQSPDETSTFVIAEGSDFALGQINLQYSIVDVTPTVVTLFGGTPAANADGVSLTTLGTSNADPADLFQALNDAIDMYGYPDIATDVALGARTIFASLPYFVYEFTNDITAQLQTIAQQSIFLVSDLAAAAVLPVQLVGDILYVATNIPAQIVARLTGVTGASIFPLLPPEPPYTSTPEQPAPADTTTLACGDASFDGAACLAS